MSQIQTVNLTLVNDMVCANCFIGRHELFRAISHCTSTLRLPLSFKLEHAPFRLINTECLPDDLPPGQERTDKKSFLCEKLGEEAFLTVEEFTRTWGETCSERISFAGPMSQSTRAHRLAQKAYHLGGQDLQCTLILHVFKANFQQDRDISDVHVLADIAEQVGMMNRDEAIRFLESDELKQQVEELCEQARSRGIRGVPVTIINGKWTVQGGTSADVFIQIFKKLAECACASPACAISPVEESLQL